LITVGETHKATTMAHPIWPLFDLRVRTPRLELRYVDDQLATELAVLASKGIHDPGFMPFANPWTDAASPDLERSSLQYYWRCRADTTAEGWMLNFAVIVDGAAIGTTSLLSGQFPLLRQFETGSWLGRAYQGRGFGKEMRAASLQLGFLGLLAEVATTAAFHDNAASRGVTHHIGYREVGRSRVLRREAPTIKVSYELSRDEWQQHVRRDDIEITGDVAARELLGITAADAD
jgi:RimJ/RimL family protein N-acetyltransferase